MPTLGRQCQPSCPGGARQAIVRTELDLELFLEEVEVVAVSRFKRQFRAVVFYIPERTFQPLGLL